MCEISRGVKKEDKMDKKVNKNLKKEADEFKKFISRG